MGCGAGVTAVTAALNGCSRVCALDISPAAVENARLNAVRHGVSDRVTVLRSDLFSGISGISGGSGTFDLVYWNSPFAEAPADHPYEAQLDYAVFDAGYDAHRRYMADGARVFLGFSEALGNSSRLMALAAAAGFVGPCIGGRCCGFPSTRPVPGSRVGRWTSTTSSTSSGPMCSMCPRGGRREGRSVHALCTLTYRQLRDLSSAVAEMIRDAHPPVARVGLFAARGTVLAFAGYLAALRLGALLPYRRPGERRGRAAGPPGAA
ncbi:methyltransferase domain-containing protein [Streptomyces olivochromogenes]|nr:methyltransferase domain-containing protein [Streptomyces olivochromogenes]